MFEYDSFKKKQISIKIWSPAKQTNNHSSHNHAITLTRNIAYTSMISTHNLSIHHYSNSHGLSNYHKYWLNESYLYTVIRKYNDNTYLMVE